jgi:hypothetical protein
MGWSRTMRNTRTSRIPQTERGLCFAAPNLEVTQKTKKNYSEPHARLECRAQQRCISAEERSALSAESA